MKLKKTFAAKKLTAVFIAGALLFTGALTGAQPSFAAGFNPAANGTSYEKQPRPALIITGTTATGGDGFQGTCKYLTKSQLDSITDENTADQYFASGKRDTYLRDIPYSALTKESQGGWNRYTVTGLSVKAIAESMGIDTEKESAVFAKGNDGATWNLKTAFQEQRFAFPANSGSPQPVEPAIALKGTEEGNPGVTLEGLPRLVFGQTAKDEYNMQGWMKWLASLEIGGRQTALNLNISGEVQSYTLADIIGSKSGSYTSQYQYTDNGTQTTVTATGIPLDKLLSDAGIPGGTVIKTNAGKTITDTSKYLLAYQAREAGRAVKGSSPLVLFGPGTTKNEVVTAITGLTITLTPPAAATGLKAASSGYKSIRLTWNQASGAQGYNIYRYNSGRKTYELIDCIQGAARTGYTDTSLKTGKKYTYRIKAYRTVSSIDLESAFSNGAAAVPSLAKTTVKLSRSGKTAINVKWKKVAGATGYQVRMGTNKKISKGKKAYTVKKGSVVKKKVTKLKKGKKYYVKVRAYRIVSGKKVYGRYSAVKAIKR